MPLVVRDSIPPGTTYVGGSAAPPSPAAGDDPLFHRRRRELVAHRARRPALVTDLQWRLQDPLPAGATGTVDFSVVVDSPYSGLPVILNTGSASFGDCRPFAEDTVGIPVAGGNAIGDTIFRDDGTGVGTANNGIQDGGEPCSAASTSRSTGTWTATACSSSGDFLVATTTSGADGSGCSRTGNYCFDNLSAGDYLVVVDTADVDSSRPGYRLTTPTPGSPSDTVAVTGLGSGGDETAPTSTSASARR